MIKIFDNMTGEVIFTYDNETNPEVIENSGFFTVFYDYDENEEATCDYSHHEYYYEVTE